MFHFRKNVYPPPGGGNRGGAGGRPQQQQQQHHPKQRAPQPQNQNSPQRQPQKQQQQQLLTSEKLPRPSSIHYTIATKPQIETPAQIRDRKIREYNAQQRQQKELQHQNPEINNNNNMIATQQLPPHGVHHSNANHYDTVSATQYETPAQIRERKIQEYNYQQRQELELPLDGSNSQHSESIRRARLAVAAPSTPETETPAQIRERKIQDYKAKKWAEKYVDTEVNTIIPTTTTTTTTSGTEDAVFLGGNPSLSSSFDGGMATAAQIRERKIREYKAKKWAEKYGDDTTMDVAMPPVITPSSSFDDGAMMTRTAANGNDVSFDLSDTVVQYARRGGGGQQQRPQMTNTSFDGAMITRARTADWSDTDSQPSEIMRTGSADGVLLTRRNTGSVDERVQVSMTRANQLSELYAMNNTYNNNNIHEPTPPEHNNINNNENEYMVPLSNQHHFDRNAGVFRPKKHETAAQIRERKKREYKAKKLAEKTGISLKSSSFDGIELSSDGDGVETSLRDSYSYDHPSTLTTTTTTPATTPVNTYYDHTFNPAVEQTRSDGVLLKNNLSFEEQAQLTRARADRLSALYAATKDDDSDDDQMNLNKTPVFRQAVPAGSLGGALAAKVEAEKWAQDRQEEAHRMKRGGTYVGHVTPTSSFDILSSDLTQSRTKSFDSPEHHPVQSGYRAANGRIYDVPSLC